MPTLVTSQLGTGARESLSDTLIMNDKSSTDLFKMITKTGNPHAILHQYPVDRPAEIDNTGVKENANPKAAENMSGNYNLLSTRHVHLTETVGVSKIAKLLIDRAGVGKDDKLLAREVSKALLSMGVAIECILLGNGDQKAEDGASGSQTRGFGSWASNAAQATEPVPALYRTPLGGIYDFNVNGGQTFAAITEDTFTAQLASLYDANGNDSDVHQFVGSALKIKIDAWMTYTPDLASNTVVRRFDNSEAVLKKNVMRIAGSFGDIRLTVSRWLFIKRGTLPTARSAAQLVVSRGSGLGFCEGAVSMAIAQDIQVNRLDPVGGDSAGKKTELDCIFFTKADPQRLTKILIGNPDTV